MGLKEYFHKRNFKKTSEPKGKIRNRKSAIFVVQKHAASHLHYDFRLAINGVLKSWAVPKGPSLNPAIKRLAVEVEDHPLAYATFEGTIPKGQYGGGTVIVWDYGTWTAEENLAQAYKKGEMRFILHGKKLKGAWHLIRTKALANKPQWLLIKSKDEFSNKKDIIIEEPNSVFTGKSLEEMAGQEQISLPKNFKPELATLVKTIPTGSEWLHEIKYDGYRILAFIENNKVNLFSRNGQDWTKKFPSIVAELEKLKIKQVLLDGELVVLNEKGISDFQLLQNALQENKDANMHYFIFDLPFNAGKDLTSISLIERKKALAKLLPKKKKSRIHYSDHVIGRGEDMFNNACAQGLEGIVSKRKDSHYKQIRTSDWVKIKCSQRQEFVIIGFTEPQGERKFFGSLLLAYYNENKKLIYCGHVGTGFTQKTLTALNRKLSKIIKTKSPLEKIPKDSLGRKVTWVKPELIAEIEFTEWTDERNLRHPAFKGLREDKKAKEIKQEIPVDHGFALTHPDKILYPKENISKLDLANYYEKIADRILPYIENRPLTLVRCPKPGAMKCFFQKNWMEGLPNAIKQVTVETSEGESQYIMLNNKQSLIAAAQMDILELHPWLSKKDKLNYPDQLVFDLDPSPEVKWKTLVDAAILIRNILSALKLKSFAKLTGGKGIHIVIPITRKYDFTEIKKIAKNFAAQLAKQFPDLFTASIKKDLRKNKIFIDYLRNEYGSTAVAVFSPRARENASIAVPISWQQLAESKKPIGYTIKTIADYLKIYPHDPWESFFTVKQSIVKLVFE